MNADAMADLNWPPPRRIDTCQPIAVAGSIGLHIAVIALAAAISVTPPSEPVRVVLINAGEGGGGTARPLLGPAPAGELAGPPIPPVEVAPPPPPPPPAAERPKIAAKPHPKPKPQPPRQQAAVERKLPQRQPEVQPTAGIGDTGVAALAPGNGAQTGGGGGGGGGSGGGAGTGVGRGVGSGRGPGVESALARYLGGVRGRLEAVKRYPRLARRRGTEGTTTLAIDITRDGQAAAVTVSSSSGSDLLDGEAAEMVGRAAPFEPLPPELDDTTLRVVVPIAFDLDS